MIKRIRKSLTVKWMGFITRRLTHPIKQLSAQMTKVSEGNFDVDIDMPARDEVGLLTKFCTIERSLAMDVISQRL